MELLKSFCFIVLISTCCNCRQLLQIKDDASVVSKYTTPSPASSAQQPPGVYQQLAHNIAERITSPFYKLFGLKNGGNNLGKLELVDESAEELSKVPVKDVSNDIDKIRDVEELSEDALNKKDEKKPEKLALHPGYPERRKIATNFEIPDKLRTANVVDSNVTTTVKPMNQTTTDWDFDWASEDEGEEIDEKNFSENGFIYILELISSAITLAWGALMAWLRPQPSSN